MLFNSQEPYVREFKNMNQFDIESKNLVTTPTTSNEVPLAIETLSIQLPDFIPTVLHVKDIESKALSCLIHHAQYRKIQFLGAKITIVKRFLLLEENTNTI